MAEKKSEFDRRKEAFEKACEVGNEDSIIKIGEALRRRFPEKTRADEKFLQNLASAYYNRGITFSENKEHDEAILEYTRAVEINPNFGEAYDNRGNTYTEKGELDSAISDYTKAIEIDPIDSGAYLNRGNCYLKEGKYEQAFSDYTNALNIRPEFADAFFGRGTIHLRKEEYNSAISDYTNAITLKPSLAGAYLGRGDRYANEGKIEKAIEDYNKFIEIHPEMELAYFKRGNNYGKTGEYRKAIADYAKVIELNPDTVEAYVGRGVAYAQNSEYENAIADFGKAIEIKNDYAEAYLNRGISYTDKNEIKNAIADFEKAIDLKPDLIEAHSNRALTIGLKAAKETEERLKQSYEEQLAKIDNERKKQLASISNPVEINKIFEEEIANSKARLEDLRKEGKDIGETLWRKLGLVWLFCFGVFALLKYYDHLPIDTIFLQLLSFSFSVIFLSSPFIWRLRRVNHDIRVERHALEDFRRKWIMLLLRVAQGDEAMRNQQTADIIQHFDKRGTPEVLNHLYHPRPAHPRPADDDSLLKRVVAMPKSLTERKE